MLLRAGDWDERVHGRQWVTSLETKYYVRGCGWVIRRVYLPLVAVEH